MLLRQQVTFNAHRALSGHLVGRDNVVARDVEAGTEVNDFPAALVRGIRARFDLLISDHGRPRYGKGQFLRYCRNLVDDLSFKNEAAREGAAHALDPGPTTTRVWLVMAKSTLTISRPIYNVSGVALAAALAAMAPAQATVWDFFETDCTSLNSGGCLPLATPYLIGTLATTGGAGASSFQRFPVPTLTGNTDFTFAFGGPLHASGAIPDVLYSSSVYVPDGVKSWDFTWDAAGMPLGIEMHTGAWDLTPMGNGYRWAGDGPSTICRNVCDIHGYWVDPVPLIDVPEPPSIGLLITAMVGLMIMALRPTYPR